MNRWGETDRVHFVGIGGVGMCGLAEILLDDGLTVSGCDVAESERTLRLASRGAVVSLGHDPLHVRDADAVIITAAVAADHPEIEAARRAGTPIVRRAELLAEVVRHDTTVAISGTHGKTTTSALLAHLLTRTGLAPTFAVGGLVKSLEAFGRRGRGGVAVCEADEYDRSFLELDPVIGVVTNIDADHLDYYGSREALRSAFAEFVSFAPFHGTVFLCGDDPDALALETHVRGKTVVYGTGPCCGLRAIDLEARPGGTGFTVVLENRCLGRVTSPLGGEHNVRNALVAIGAGIELGVDFDSLAAAAVDFSGVGRRFEHVGERAGFTVVDDYAHHPTEVEAVMSAATQMYPGRRIVVVFQPHLFSRTKEHAEAFGRVLGMAERLIVLPIYAAREAPIPGISHRLVKEAASRSKQGGEVVDGQSVEAAPEVLDRILEPGDVLMTLGAGDVDRVGRLWLEAGP